MISTLVPPTVENGRLLDLESTHQSYETVAKKKLDRPSGRKSKPSQRGKEPGPLEVYLQEINETPLLTAGEEKDLAYRIGEGDCEARDHLVRANLRLVVNLARAYVGKGLPIQDLIAEGNLGLLRAVEGFDPDMNTRFSTYASYWIKQSIKRMIINTSKPIRVPAYMAEWMVKWNRAKAKLQDELCRPPTREEIAQTLAVSSKQLKIIDKALRIYGSTFQTSDQDNGSSIDELSEGATTATPLTQLSDNDDLDHVFRELDKMEEREATVLRLRFGLLGDDPKTLKEIGVMMGLTRERVRQIEGEALAKLRESLETD
jgi:RNA polymerase primary sigma factor